MKKFNRFFLKKFNAVLIALLALLGCSNKNFYDMYGTPTPDYKFAIKGQITNVEDGKPIEGIRVIKNVAVPEYATRMTHFNPNLAVFSDRNGNFLKVVNDTIGGVPLGFWDEKNNSFHFKDIVVRFEEGRKVAVVDVALTPKTEE